MEATEEHVKCKCGHIYIYSQSRKTFKQTCQNILHTFPNGCTHNALNFINGLILLRFTLVYTSSKYVSFELMTAILYH